MIPVNTVSASDGTSYVYDGYIYDYWGNVQESPAAFQLESTINADSIPELSMQGIDDVCASKDGRIFLTDTVASRIYILDSKGTFITSIKVIKNERGSIELDENGKQIILTSPEGTFVHEQENELYIADTGAERIIVLDLNTYTLKRIIKKPENMMGVTEFKPSKVIVDDTNRIYAVVQSSYEGILQLSAKGEFIGYYGVNVPSINLAEYFWKTLATDKQKDQMKKTYAPAFNNLAVDGEGFVMAVTYDKSAEDMVFRLNSKGENVLRQTGNTNVIGDIRYRKPTDKSQFVDIAVTDYGTYALLDKTKGRIFIYDFDGVLLNAFGSLGKLKGEFQTPSSICFLGDKLIVTDSTLKCAYILEPTDFGTAMMNASESYYNGDWNEALDSFHETIRLNANYEIAYSGIGKNYLMKDEYKKAMYYFNLGNNRTYYSKAYYGYRGEQLKEHFGVIAGVAVILLFSLFYSEIRYNKKRRKVV
jgi:sugar lactone lactonase YvrE